MLGSFTMMSARGTGGFSSGCGCASSSSAASNESSCAALAAALSTFSRTGGFRSSSSSSSNLGRGGLFRAAGLAGLSVARWNNCGKAGQENFIFGAPSLTVEYA